jgi:hypothetical protein
MRWFAGLPLYFAWMIGSVPVVVAGALLFGPSSPWTYLAVLASMGVIGIVWIRLRNRFDLDA